MPHICRFSKFVLDKKDDAGLRNKYVYEIKVFTNQYY